VDNRQTDGANVLPILSEIVGVGNNFFLGIRCTTPHYFLLSVNNFHRFPVDSDLSCVSSKLSWQRL